MKKHQIFLVEDHTILRDGLRELLSSEPDLEVVGEAGEGREAIRRIGELMPDLVLMDLSMPGVTGIDATREIRRRNPDIKIVALTVHTDESYIHATLEAGANGYVSKSSSRDELVSAIRNVLNGKLHLSPEMMDKVLLGYVQGRKTPSSTSTFDTLTNRERQILKLVAEVKSNKQIAEYLCISVKTVEKHRANLMKKLDLHNASALTAYAIKKGIVVH